MSERSKAPPRLTIDTNHIVSGAISPGNYSSQLLLLWQKGAVHWVQTSQTFHELQEVLRRERFRVKYGFQETEMAELLETIATGTEFITALPVSDLPLHSRDKKDNKFLACALGGDCDYLVTEDEDLLVLNGERELGKLQILTAYEFLKRTGHL
jgi:uncharacterized protein